MELKRCSKCGEERPLEEFSKYRRKPVEDMLLINFFSG